MKKLFSILIILLLCGESGVLASGKLESSQLCIDEKVTRNIYSLRHSSEMKSAYSLIGCGVGNPASLRRIKDIDVFNVNTEIGKVILTPERYGHIQQKHPEVKLDDIWWTLAMPNKVEKENYRNWIFKRHYDLKWLEVIVRQTGERLFVITAYYEQF